ncbi:hypothetical protein EYR41_007673 [Orbilia oligospora]|uniref:Uncharacterized protein n=1 Tax=Orbilia oligospora TaxID=2813651 RepID=A0A8H2E390_ORBOL|nr:hypothetical protein EYR41_007673 [Orbilia oligospora]
MALCNRYAPIAADALNETQKEIHDFLANSIGQYFKQIHSRVAKQVGVEDHQIENILNGKPPGGTQQEEASWQIARALVEQKGPLPVELWSKAESLFGKAGAGALIHYAGFYAYTSIILNGAAVPVPAGEKIWPIA